MSLFNNLANVVKSVTETVVETTSGVANTVVENSFVKSAVGNVSAAASKGANAVTSTAKAGVKFAAEGIHEVSGKVANAVALEEVKVESEVKKLENAVETEIKKI